MSPFNNILKPLGFILSEVTPWMFMNNKGQRNGEACCPLSSTVHLFTTVICNNHWYTDAKYSQMVPFFFFAMAQMA